MQEKLTNPFQQKLDALEELPDGFSFEPSAAWSKLEEKLSPKKAGSKKTVWYYAAAAAVFVCISVIAFMQMAKETAQPTFTKTAEQPKQTSIVPVIANNQKNETTGLKNQTKKLTKVKQQFDTPVKNTLPLTVTVEKNETLILPQTTNETEIAVAKITEPVMEITPVASKPPVLKIIHINELMQEYQLEQQRVAEAKRNQKPAEEDIIIEKNTEPSKPWYKKSKQNLLIKNQ
jgi:hypothetical protein